MCSGCRLLLQTTEEERSGKADAAWREADNASSAWDADSQDD